MKRRKVFSALFALIFIGLAWVGWLFLTPTDYPVSVPDVDMNYPTKPE